MSMSHGRWGPRSVLAQTAELIRSGRGRLAAFWSREEAYRGDNCYRWAVTEVVEGCLSRGSVTMGVLGVEPDRTGAGGSARMAKVPAFRWSLRLDAGIGHMGNGEGGAPTLNARIIVKTVDAKKRSRRHHDCSGTETAMGAAACMACFVQRFRRLSRAGYSWACFLDGRWCHPICPRLAAEPQQAIGWRNSGIIFSLLSAAWSHVRVGSRGCIASSGCFWLRSGFPALFF